MDRVHFSMICNFEHGTIEANLLPLFTSNADPINERGHDWILGSNSRLYCVLYMNAP